MNNACIHKTPRISRDYWGTASPRPPHIISNCWLSTPFSLGFSQLRRHGPETHQPFSISPSPPQSPAPRNSIRDFVIVMRRWLLRATSLMDDIQESWHLQKKRLQDIRVKWTTNNYPQTMNHTAIPSFHKRRPHSLYIHLPS